VRPLSASGSAAAALWAASPDLAIKRAAEAAAPQCLQLLRSAIKSMSVQDAQAILTGGQTAATDYFRKATSHDLFKRFLPLVIKATEKVEFAQK